MIKYKTLFPLIFFILLQSCAVIIELDKEANENIKITSSTTDHYCKNRNNPNDTIASDNVQISEHYHYILKKLKKYNLKFIDKFVLLALIQMNLRPDLASPSSNLYLLINYKNEKKHLSFIFNQKNSKPYLFALHSLLIDYKSRYRLNNFAYWLDKYFKQSKIVGKKFAHFLEQNKELLKNFPIFKRRYFKAEHPLRVGESLPRLNYDKIIKHFKKKNRTATIRTHLFNYKILNKNLDIKCNYDFMLYDRSHYLISQKEKNNLSLGLMDSNGNSILSVATQNLEELAPQDNSFLIHSPSKFDSLAMCFIKNNKLKSDLAIISTGSRDPGQLIYHLIQYEIYNSKSISEAAEYINFPRHLFLLSPVRMIYESERGSKEQLNRFLSMNFPIYYDNAIGNIWLYAKFNLSNEKALIIDPRADAELSCHFDE